MHFLRWGSRKLWPRGGKRRAGRSLRQAALVPVAADWGPQVRWALSVPPRAECYPHPPFNPHPYPINQSLSREAHPSQKKNTPKLTACVVCDIECVLLEQFWVRAIALTCRAYVAVLIVDSVKPKQGRLDHLLRSHGPTPWNFWARAFAPWPKNSIFTLLFFYNECIFILAPWKSLPQTSLDAVQHSVF